MAIAANFGFTLASVDIRAVFLQSNVLDRDVFVKPPADVKRPGIILKLKKPLFGLDNVSWKFWLRVKEVFFSELNLRTLYGEVFYFLNIDGQLQGAVITHVDNFNLAGTDELVDEVITHVEQGLPVSKIKKDLTCFIGLDIKVVEDGIKIVMDDYTQSLNDIKEIRKT